MLTIPIEEYSEGKLELPIGVKIGTEIVKDVVLHPFTDLTLEVLHDRRKKEDTTFPGEWLYHSLPLCIESIGSVPVFSAYKDSGFQNPPSVIDSIPILDANAILLASHVFNYGAKISDVEIRCPRCKKPYVTNLTLAGVPITGDFDGPYPMQLRLPAGLKVKKGLDFEEGTYNTVYLNVPILGSLKKETKNPSESEVARSRRLYFRCIDHLENRDSDDKVTNSLTRKQIDTYGLLLLEEMTPKDRLVFTAALNSFKQVDTALNLKCPNCTTAFGYKLDTDFFFQI